MHRDPVIDRIRATRRELAARLGHDVSRLAEHYRELERTAFADRAYVAPDNAEASRAAPQVEAHGGPPPRRRRAATTPGAASSGS